MHVNQKWGQRMKGTGNSNKPVIPGGHSACSCPHYPGPAFFLRMSKLSLFPKAVGKGCVCVLFVLSRTFLTDRFALPSPLHWRLSSPLPPTEVKYEDLGIYTNMEGKKREQSMVLSGKTYTKSAWGSHTIHGHSLHRTLQNLHKCSVDRTQNSKTKSAHKQLPWRPRPHTLWSP